MAAAASHSRLFAEALEAGKRKDYDKAVNNLEKIVSETEHIPEALLYLGRSYHALGKYEKSIGMYKHFILLRPKESAGYFFLGRTYLTLRMEDYALRYLRRAYSLDSANPQILGLLGLTYLKLKRPELASPLLGHAVELTGSTGRLYNGYLNALSAHGVKEFYAGNHELAGQMFHFLLNRGMDADFIHIYLGLIARNKGDYSEALSHYDTALRSSPDDAGLLMRKAAMLYFTGRREEAAEIIEGLKQKVPFIRNDFFTESEMSRTLCMHHFTREEYRKSIYYGNRALKEDYSDPVAHGIVGEAYRNLGDMEKAKNHFLRSVEADPHNTETRYGLAMVYWQEEKYQAMLTELQKIISRDPDNTSVQFFIVMCKCRLHYPPKQTIPLVREAIKHLGPDPNLFNALAEQYIRGDLDHLADKWLKKAITLQNDNYDAYINLIDLYREQEQFTELETVYYHYFSVFSDDPSRRKDFIILLMSMEKYEDAVRQILKYLPYRTKDEMTKRLLAICYRKTGQYRDAAILYKELLMKRPKSEEYIKSIVFCYEKMGKVQFAADFLQRALREVPPTLSLRLILGSLLYKAGDEETALRIFREAADDAPGDSRAYRNIAVVYKNKGFADMSNKFTRHAEEIEKKIVG
jgi:tetratricopeptide (TPR) repeat protein